MLVYPHVSRNQVFLLSIRLHSQSMTGLAIEDCFADVVEIVVISVNGASRSIDVGCCSTSWSRTRRTSSHPRALPDDFSIL